MNKFNKYLNRHGNSRKEAIIPVQFREQLTDHRTDRHWMTTTRFRIDFLHEE